MTRSRKSLCAVALLSLLSCADKARAASPQPPAVAAQSAAFKPNAALSDVVNVPRPPEGEFFGLYLMGKKVGWLNSTITLGPKPGELTAMSDYRFKVKMGQRSSERIMKETKVYESKPGGKLLSLRLEQAGDGGDQVLEGLSNGAGGLTVTRKRPGHPNDTFEIKDVKETVEDADQPRVALKRNKTMVGSITDSIDLKQYKVTTTVEPEETRTVRGVAVKLRKAVTLSEKENVPTEAWFDSKGRTLEVRFGATMMANAEPEDVAKRFDVVEVFGLTRVVLPKPVPPSARQVPGSLTLVMSGLPEKFRASNYRQTYKPLPGDKVEVAINVSAPKKHDPLPLIDPNGGVNLESTVSVEASNAGIRALSKKVIGDEKDSWAAAKKVSRWVYQNVKSDYGSSSDRSTDVLKTMKGDCTEHSLLAVALLRAGGIPSKRVDGLVYVMNEDNVPALYWHEWVEAYVGEWTQLDPTFGQDVADATHFRLGEESSSEMTPLIGSLKVFEVR